MVKYTNKAVGHLVKAEASVVRWACAVCGMFLSGTSARWGGVPLANLFRGVHGPVPSVPGNHPKRWACLFA